MARRKRGKQTFQYECSLTNEKFKRTKKVENIGDLISVAAYYDLHPDKDDRPENIKVMVAAEAEDRAAMEALFEANQIAAEDVKGPAPLVRPTRKPKRR